MTAAKRRAASVTVTCGTSSVQQQQPQQQYHFQQQQQQQQSYQHHQIQEQQHQLHSQSTESHQTLLQQHYNNSNNNNNNNQHHHQQQQQQQEHHLENQTASHQAFRDCSIKLPLDILWLPKSAMRPVVPDAAHTDCILVVGVSRPKLAVVFLTVMLISLFLTFHVLYDSAVYNLQAAQVVTERHRRLALLSSTNIGLNHIPNGFKPPTAAAGPPPINIVAGGNQINHPMVFPSNRVHFPKTSRRLPQALIIGIRKCGTRALLEMLYLHPRIQKAGGEVHFFDRDENYLKGLEWYRKKMPHSFRGQITIEKSPSYFVSPEVPERVRAMNASIKLLLIVREPVTRAISDYTQLRSHAATASLPLADTVMPLTPGRSLLSSSGGAVAAMQKIQMKPHIYSKLNVYSSAQVYDNSLDGGGGPANIVYTTTPVNAVSSATIVAKSFEELAIFPNGTVNETYRPLTISMYHLHLHRWLEVFPREQLLIVNGDRLIEDPVSELRRIENFLGIEHRVTSSHFYFNETKGFYCLRYDSGDRCLRETKGRRHPYVNPVVVSKLRKFFAEHNQRFYELVGEDLGWPEE